MNTGKKNNKLISKYLSPCRTFGLKRKSTSPGTPNNKCLKSVNSEEKCGDITPSRPINNFRKMKGVENIPKEISLPKKKTSTVEKLKLELQEQNNFTEKENVDTYHKVEEENIIASKETELHSNEKRLVSEQRLSDSIDPPLRGFVSQENLADLIKSINSKIDEIDKLKRNLNYSKKHNLNEVHELTHKWKQACRDSLLAVHENLKFSGREIPLSAVIKEHNIPYEKVGYNEETTDFD